MAQLTRTNLSFEFYLGPGEDGSGEYKRKTFRNITPEISDDDLQEIANGIAALQSHVVQSLERNNEYSMQVPV
ncbi:DUF1659 domain-containing protein [Marinococcus halophilus]|uniref:DUF1659 domain-containing protein n=1 Tax=Marinococcus halophilus TaxID=1371 RepID=A0A510Y3Y4_MARHA|nr:DUF1659 domain-containing protein [Marinococcus halophilus]OZT80039.1 DUF1659 domain-containing protein [Marinococcus halophilus]GEK58038.1 hypothetical protein MHA01_09430 [Marinococcus halophilus]